MPVRRSASRLALVPEHPAWAIWCNTLDGSLAKLELCRLFPSGSLGTRNRLPLHHRRFVEGQLDGKGGPFARGAVHQDGAAVLLDDALADGQSQAGPLMPWW